MVEAWAPDGSWVATSVHPHSGINAPSGPPTYHLWRLPTMERSASFAAGTGQVSWNAERSLVAVVRLSLEGGGEGPEEGRGELWSAERAQRLRVLPLPRGTQPQRWLSHGSVLQVRLPDDRVKLLALDSDRSIDVVSRAEGDRCRVVLRDDRGHYDGDVASFFRVRRGGTLRSAVLVAGDPLIDAARRPGKLARMWGQPGAEAPPSPAPPLAPAAPIPPLPVVEPPAPVAEPPAEVPLDVVLGSPPPSESEHAAAHSPRLSRKAPRLPNASSCHSQRKLDRTATARSSPT